MTGCVELIKDVSNNVKKKFEDYKENQRKMAWNLLDDMKTFKTRIFKDVETGEANENIGDIKNKA